MGFVISIWFYFSFERLRPIAVVLPLPGDDYESDEIWEIWESDISTSEPSSKSESNSETENEPTSSARRESPLEGRPNPFATSELIVKNNFFH